MSAYRPPINIHDERLRQRNIWDLLRRLQLDRPLPLDSFYADGEIGEWQWNAGHLYREDRLVQLEARRKGTEPRAGDKVRKGLSFKACQIERALRIERRELTPEYHEVARALIGEISARVEAAMAKRVTARLGVIYQTVPEHLGALYR